MRNATLMPETLAKWLESRQWSQAEAFCEQAEKDADPRSAFWRASICMSRGRFDEAARWLATAESNLPDSSDVAYLRGVCCQRMGQIDEALIHWRRAVALDSDHPDALYNLAKGLADCGDDAAAVEGYVRLLALHPDHAEARYNLANRWLALDRPYAAIDCLSRLVATEPHHTDAWINMGLAYKAIGDCQRAEDCYRNALVSDPDSVTAHWNLAHLLLLTDRWKEGYAEYEWRLRRDEAPTIMGHIPRWTGGDLPDAHLLVWAEQGIGDAIQFLRYLPMAARRVRACSLYCHGTLVSLARPLVGTGRIIPFGEPVEGVTVHAPLVSLPHILGMPDPVDSWSGPYLSVPAPVDIGQDPDRRRVGLVWAGNPSHANDRHRSMNPDQFDSLLHTPGFRFFNFQVNGKDALAGIDGQERLIDLSERLTDFADTAALIDEMDLIITVDTAVAHLAGAMERPVWMLVPRLPDWRWPLTDRRTPWYPSMRIFRQQATGCWDPVIAEIASALTIWHHSGGGPNDVVDGPLHMRESR